MPKDIADKIHKVSETEFNVERSVVDTILENQAELMRSARIVPEKEGDKIVGIRLFGIRPDSLLGTLGIENGDRLSQHQRLRDERSAEGARGVRASCARRTT